MRKPSNFGSKIQSGSSNASEDRVHSIGLTDDGMAVAFTMVDALKKSGVNLTRKGLISTLNSLNEADNPFLYKGVSAKNSSKDHFTITQEYQAKYDAALGDYKPISDLIDFRGKITFP